MKTAISLPDSLFQSAERTAARLGIPRSQLVARALEEFIQHHQTDQVTERLNAVYGTSATMPLQPEASDLAAGLDSLRQATAHDTW